MDMKEFNFLENRIRIYFWKPFALDFQIYIKKKQQLTTYSEWTYFRFMLGFATNLQDDYLMDKHE